MGLRKGQWIGGVRKLEDLRERCVIDSETSCWRLRKASGAFAGELYRLDYMGAVIPAARLSFMLAFPRKPLASTDQVWRCCSTRECVNPRHLASGTRAQWGAAMRESGRARTPAKHAAAVANGRRTSALTPELRLWAIESSQGNTEAAHGLGIRPSRVADWRMRAKRKTSVAPASVFQLARFDLREAA